MKDAHKLRHGARAAQRAWENNQLDRRCGWVRQLLERKQEMAVSRGAQSWDDLDAERRILIDRIAFMEVAAMMQEACALKAGVITAAGELVPPLGRHYLSFAEALKRHVLALLVLDQRARDRQRAGDDWIEVADEATP